MDGGQCFSIRFFGGQLTLLARPLNPAELFLTFFLNQCQVGGPSDIIPARVFYIGIFHCYFAFDQQIGFASADESLLMKSGEDGVADRRRLWTLD